MFFKLKQLSHLEKNKFDKFDLCQTYFLKLLMLNEFFSDGLNIQGVSILCGVNYNNIKGETNYEGKS